MTELSLVAPNGYSHVASIPAGKRLVWTAGQVPVDATGAVAVGDWAEQTRQTLRNVETALAAAGAGWADVFKLTVYVTDVAELPTIRAVRDEFVDVERPPTSTLVRVAGLVNPDFLIEIEAVAAI
ncbi:RidA family protein [Asanoa iriomotensis]|uniref:Enamine deaminase RidA n=1 Tax=Asanoa iriomotensis TaxID=234613 RepID=A0ABQ4C7T8_9ACTN|nr:RidA family protein [Asanoa iriomotensis]GIF58853.1 enamine deaminase RidA [Asanoa iriomotensis]